MKACFAVAVVMFMISPSVHATDCPSLLKEHLQTDLSLSYQEFDQTLGKGFSRNGGRLRQETADLIDAYIQRNG